MKQVVGTLNQGCLPQCCPEDGSFWGLGKGGDRRRDTVEPSIFFIGEVDAGEALGDEANRPVRWVGSFVARGEHRFKGCFAGQVLLVLNQREANLFVEP